MEQPPTNPENLLPEDLARLSYETHLSLRESLLRLRASQGLNENSTLDREISRQMCALFEFHFEEFKREKPVFFVPEILDILNGDYRHIFFINAPMIQEFFLFRLGLVQEYPPSYTHSSRDFQRLSQEDRKRALLLSTDQEAYDMEKYGFINNWNLLWKPLVPGRGQPLLTGDRSSVPLSHLLAAFIPGMEISWYIGNFFGHDLDKIPHPNQPDIHIAHNGVVQLLTFTR